MKKTIKTGVPLTGKQQQVSLTKNIVKNDTFFPKGVHIRDIDKTVIDAVKAQFEIVSEGDKVPFIDLFSIQRYSEFMKTWQFTDETHTVKLPFMCLVRNALTKKGTNLGNTFNIPSIPTFNLWRRPIVKNGRTSMEYYQIPQPVNIDLSYTLHLFTTHLPVVNKMQTLMRHLFRSSQLYIFVNGHCMPMKLEGEDDQSELSNLETRRYYHMTYTLTVHGYLLREEDFKKLSSVDRIKVKMCDTIMPSTKECRVDAIDLDCDLCLNFKFGRKAEPSKTFRLPENLEFYYDNQNPSNPYQYFLNGQPVSLPFTGNKGDELTVAHSIESKRIINIKVCGRRLPTT